MVGTSLLAMPWGMERAGLAMGVLLVAGMGTLCWYTSLCVVKAQAAHGEYLTACGPPPGGWEIDVVYN